MTNPTPKTSPETPPGDRIAKVIARAGICSRREAEQLIAAGRVVVNGKVLSTPALNVTGDDKIVVDGKAIGQRERARLWRYHKPSGLVTTHRDPEGRSTVFDHLPDSLPRVISIGRLDITSEGLLLLTNDGELARRLELPATGWTRRYRVRAYGKIDQPTLDKLAKGVRVAGIDYGPIEAKLEREQRDNLWLTMVLREGKNREIRKVLDHIGLTVNRLIRVSYGPFQLGDLAREMVEEVPRKVLRDQLGQRLAAGLEGLEQPRAERDADRRRQK
ncbi:23S rRNA pseudouridine2605 synthase [Rhodoligotrophos appendicifer]